MSAVFVGTTPATVEQAEEEQLLFELRLLDADRARKIRQLNELRRHKTPIGDRLASR